MSGHDARTVEAKPCAYCGASPPVKMILVDYVSTEHNGVRGMFRVECVCGAHGKCSTTHVAAIASWNSPWQALPFDRRALPIAATPADDVGRVADAAYTREAEIETRFWAIVDRDGLTGLPSDMFDALERLVRRAALAPAPDETDALRVYEWQPIETAPYAMCVMAARFDDAVGEWIYSVVLSPPSKPFTHWRMLPAPPAALAPGARND